MSNFVKFAIFTALFLPFSLGCNTQADTSAVATGVDDSVVQTEDQMKAMSAEYESQGQSK